MKIVQTQAGFGDRKLLIGEMETAGLVASHAGERVRVEGASLGVRRSQTQQQGKMKRNQFIGHRFYEG